MGEEILFTAAAEVNTSFAACDCAVVVRPTTYQSGDRFHDERRTCVSSDFIPPVSDHSKAKDGLLMEVGGNDVDFRVKTASSPVLLVPFINCLKVEILLLIMLRYDGMDVPE